MSTPDDAIRLYLMYLDDPNKLRDEAAIAEHERAVETAKDPVDRLLAIAALERAQQVDGTEFRDAFVRDAKAWADEHKVTASAFVKMGVHVDDLAEAGFDVGRKGAARRSSSPSGRTRVTVEAVRAAALGTTEPFTLSTLGDMTGASAGTLRKVVTELMDAGQVVDLGPDANHDGRGRAPILYRVA